MVHMYIYYFIEISETLRRLSLVEIEIPILVEAVFNFLGYNYFRFRLTHLESPPLLLRRELREIQRQDYYLPRLVILDLYTTPVG